MFGIGATEIVLVLFVVVIVLVVGALVLRTRR